MSQENLVSVDDLDCAVAKREQAQVTRDYVTAVAGTVTFRPQGQIELVHRPVLEHARHVTRVVIRMGEPRGSWLIPGLPARMLM